jgi:hypothetical protein
LNIFELKEYNQDRVVYLYQPEGKGAFGEVAFIYSEGNAKLLKRAEDPSDWYANKALSKVEECALGKELPKKFIQAWY